MAVHRAWRVLKTSGEGCFSISYIAFRSAPGGASQMATGGPIQSGCYSNDCGGYGATRAFNDNGIFHDPCNGAGSWLGWDYGSNPGDWPDISYVAMRRRGGYPEQGPSGFVLQFTDDDPAGSPTWNGYDSYAFDWYSDGGIIEFGGAPEVPMTDPTEVLFSGEIETYVVPAGAALLTTKVWAGGGHGGQYGGGNYGGGGGFVRATFPVEPGDVIALQVGEGGRNANEDGTGRSRGRGGWPDGGDGSRGDTWGGGGGGSSRVWLNGVLMVVAGGGGAAAGYAGHGGGGGNPGANGADGNTGANLTRPGYDDGPYGWKVGRRISEVGPVGRTGGNGGWMLGGTGDDGGGAGGGYHGGGGSGGDGRAGGGGLSWAHASCTNLKFVTGGTGSGSAGGAGDPDYTGNYATGKISNNQDPAGHGRILLETDVGDLVAGGEFTNTIWSYMFDRPADTYHSSDRQNRTVRWSFQTAACRIKSGSTIRLNMRGAGAGTHIVRAFVGKCEDPGDNPINHGLCYAEAPVPITWGGNPGVDIATDVLVNSDPVDIEIEEGDRILFSLYLADGQQSYTFIGGSGFGFDHPGQEEAGGRDGNYRWGVWVGDRADEVGDIWDQQESYDYWNAAESVQVLASGDGGGPDPEPFVRRRYPVIPT